MSFRDNYTWTPIKKKKHEFYFNMNSFSQPVVFAISKSPSGMWGFLVEDTQWEGKNSRGNVEAKELICMTHGHELRGDAGGEE